MPGPTSLGIVLEFATKKATAAAKLFSNGLKRITRDSKKTGKAVKGAEKDVKDFSVVLLNMQNGLNSLTQTFAKVQKASAMMIGGSVKEFASYETAIAKLDISLGVLGNNVPDALLNSRNQVVSLVKELGASTSFTTVEVAGALENLIKSGMSPDVAMNIVKQALNLSAASGGTVDLDTAASTAIGAYNKLSTGMGKTQAEIIAGTNLFMDQLVRTSAVFDIKMGDLDQAFKSGRSAFSAFKGSSTEFTLSLAGAIKQSGFGKADVGHAVAALRKGIGSINRNLDAEMRSGKTSDLKAIVASRLLDVNKKDFTNKFGDLLPLDTIVPMLAGKVKKLAGKIGPNGDLYGKEGALGLITTMFGGAIAPEVIAAFMNTEAKRKVEFASLVEDIRDSKGLAQLGADRHIETLNGALDILGSSWSAVMTSMGESAAEFINPMINQTSTMLSKLNTWMNENTHLVKSFAKIVIAVGAVAGVMSSLTAGAGFLVAGYMVVKPVFLAVSGWWADMVKTFTTKSMIFRILFRSMLVALVPVGLFLAKLALATAVIGHAWESDLGGIKTFIMGWVEDLKQVFSVVFQMLSGQGVDATIWDAMSERAQKIVTLIVVIKNRLVDFFTGFAEGFMTSFGAYASVVGVVIEWIGYLLSALGQLALFMGLATNKSKENSEALNDWGYIIGLAAGVVFSLWTVEKLLIIVQGIKILRLKLVAMWTARATLVKWAHVAVEWAMIAAGAVLVASIIATQMAMELVAANPIGAAITAIIIIIILFIVYWDEISAAISTAVDWMIEYKYALLLLLGPIGAVIAAMVYFFEIMNIDSFSKFWSSWTKGVKLFGNAIKRVVQDSVRFVRSVIAAIPAWFSGVISDLGDMWPEFWGQAGVAFEGFKSDLMSFIGILEKIGMFFPNLIKDAFMIVFNFIRSTLSNIWSGIKNMIGAVGMIAGGDFVGGFAQGAAGAAEVMLPGVGGDIVTGFTDFLQNSPAKKGPLTQTSMEQYGSNVVTLFAEGVNSKKSTLDNVGNTLASGIQPTAFSTITPQRESTGDTVSNNQTNNETNGSNIQMTLQNTFDVKLSPQSLSDGEADNFIRWIADNMSDVIEEGLIVRGLG